ncbi:glucosamine-6-phosphate deaminase [Peloplasma aerotolerans]|uniref:Glucosamine-6-phosphate deaminase n=1 Tax=Peloplasma aerotolerans TaxID=3044389 RepID=A0AAW6U8Y2_9MOLU|nr:glucosamine-6-phosphate deaminase [Mariniplasma sp. M4Ah]MDI6452419.1 glucosamine-6-phosphate deaminase [Mariniplasma sp. M4Ah]MDR4968573.1 glucosamine-6-phosphate deaminase [Acholeplasmataceae bacterium]
MKKIGNFNIFIDKSFDSVCELAAQEILDFIKKKPNAVIGLATGNTPKGLYKSLVKKAKEQNVSFKQVTTFNLDEYVGLDEKSSDSYNVYMQKHLFQHLDFDENRIHLPSLSKDIEQNIDDYQKLLSEHKIDIQILGIGSNGHIGFNEPGTKFDSKVHLADLTESTIYDNQIYFKDTNNIPKQAITMGIDDIMKAGKILLLASGSNKRKTIKTLIDGQITESFPASILKKHPLVYIYLDHHAALDISTLQF